MEFTNSRKKGFPYPEYVIKSIQTVISPSYHSDTIVENSIVTILYTFLPQMQAF